MGSWSEPAGAIQPLVVCRVAMRLICAIAARPAARSSSARERILRCPTRPRKSLDVRGASTYRCASRLSDVRTDSAVRGARSVQARRRRRVCSNAFPHRRHDPEEAVWKLTPYDVDGRLRAARHQEVRLPRCESQIAAHLAGMRRGAAGALLPLCLRRCRSPGASISAPSRLLRRASSAPFTRSALDAQSCCRSAARSVAQARARRAGPHMLAKKRT
jgi:hypothetical protein